MTLSYNQIAARGLERIAGLSDGLFAIAMTLIVLEIRIPDPGAVSSEPELWAAIVGLAPRFVTYLLSFLTLGIFWSGQQTELNHLARADRHLAWLNLAFLSAIAVMPFSTSLLAEFITFRLALLIYWFNIFLVGLALYATWTYSTRAGLLKEGTSPEVSRAIKRRIIVGQSLYAFGALLSLISTYWSIAFIVLVQLNFAVAPRIRLLSRI
jgi:uncharacterized membrane protein